MSHSIQTIFFTLFLIFSPSCSNKTNTGKLLINSPSEGSYELYKIASEEPLQLVSESRGQYNRIETLEIGQYLIMADCSYQTVIVNPNKQVTIISHDIEFIKPDGIDDTSNLTIQCHRFTKNHTTQKIEGRFKLKVLDGSHEILVAMKPLRFDFSKLAPNGQPSIIKQQLSAINVKPIEGFNESSKYFISPVSELLSITSFQKTSEWFLLLPGEYWIELNGSKESVQVKEGESVSLSTSTISVNVSKRIPLGLSKKVLGKPQYVELNKHHWLNLNEEYLILPGEIELKLSGSLKPKKFIIPENERFVANTNSITVNFKCKPWDYECLAQKKIFLYKKDSAFPFAIGNSDIALLYFEKEAYVSLQGSKKVKYHLSNRKKDHFLNAGYVNFVPNYKSRSQYFTDLTRIETVSKNFSGDSIDFPVGSANKIPLITGLYSLAQYNSTVRGDFDRKKNQFRFYVSKDKMRTINYNVNLSERKYKYYTKHKKTSNKSKTQVSRKNVKRMSHTIKFH